MTDTPPPAADDGDGENALERFNAMLRERLMGRTPHVGIVRIGEDIIHYTVAVVLVAAAVLVLYETVYDLIAGSGPIDEKATAAVNGVLFAIIVIEVMRTVIAHFEHGGLQLQPFLIIAIISAVREILTVGARLSLSRARGEPAPGVVHEALLELGVNGAVVVGLALSLVLIRRFAGIVDDGLGD